MAVRAPWIAHYDRGVPASLEPYPSRTILDYLSDFAKTRPRTRALIFKGHELSYGDLEALSDAFAVALAEMGVAQGQRVGLLLPNCPQFLIAELAAWKLGAIVAPLNPIYTEHELEAPIREHGIETLVTLTRFYQRVKRVQANTGLRRIIATNIKEYFPPLLRLLFTIVRERREGDNVAVAAPDREFARLLERYRGRIPARVRITPESPAVLLMSGGTTGTPKGVIGRHDAYVRTAIQVEAWVRSVLGPGESVIMLPLPLFHVYANVGIQGLALLTGNPIALVPNPRDLPDLLATIRRVRPAFFNGVPTLYVALLNHPDVRRGKVDFKSIRICFSGASALMADTKTHFEALTGGRIVEGYSLTEAQMAAVANPVRGEKKTGSVGMPLPDVGMTIVDPDDGSIVLPQGELGEIAIRAPQIMQGYWRRPEETKEMVREDADGNRTLYTGDLGYIDTDGYLFIVDRKKDLIKTSGYQVWPREIEEVISAHPAVHEVGVAGLPDKMRGEKAKAWIVLNEGATATEADMKAWCRERLAAYKVPAKYEFVSELPKTQVGKVLRRALRESESKVAQEDKIE